MARISVEPQIQCDKCGEKFGETVHHGRVYLRLGFGDLSTGGENARTALVADLCDTCAHELYGFVAEQTSKLDI